MNDELKTAAQQLLTAFDEAMEATECAATHPSMVRWLKAADDFREALPSASERQQGGEADSLCWTNPAPNASVPMAPTGVTRTIQVTAGSCNLTIAGNVTAPAATRAGKPVAWANFRHSPPSYVPFRTEAEAAASVENSRISATQEGPYSVAALYADTPQAPPAAPSADNWQQFAKDGENAQAVIERHRREHDALLRLLAKERTMYQNGGAAAPSAEQGERWYCRNCHGFRVHEQRGVDLCCIDCHSIAASKEFVTQPSAPSEEQMSPDHPIVGTWCEYVAGMIGAYLEWPVDDSRIKAVAGIIQRRVWANTQPAVPVGPTEPNGWREALQFYADRSHFTIADEEAWDTVSGEPQNFWCDEAGTATVEDGTVAAMALFGTPLPGEEEGAAAPKTGGANG